MDSPRIWPWAVLKAFQGSVPAPFQSQQGSHTTSSLLVPPCLCLCCPLCPGSPFPPPPTFFMSPHSFKSAQTAPPLGCPSRPSSVYQANIGQARGGVEGHTGAGGPMGAQISLPELRGKEEGAVVAQPRGSRPAWRVRTGGTIVPDNS